MKQKPNIKTIFWSSTAFFFIFNIVGIIIFKNNVRLSINTLVATLIFIVLLLRGIFAYSGKNDQYLLLRKYVSSRFNKYSWPTREQLKDFYIKATIYFAVLPFYLPLAVFSSKNSHSLWCLLLLLVSQFAIVGIEIRKMMLEKKNGKPKRHFWKKKEKNRKNEKSSDIGNNRGIY